MSEPLIWTDLEHITPGSYYLSLSRHRPLAYAQIVQARQRGAEKVFSFWNFQEENHTQCPSDRQGLQAFIDTYYPPLDNKLKIIAVTGTNGKSSTTALLQAALEKAGYPTTLIGTMGVRFSCHQLPISSALTTPNYADLRSYIYQASRQGHHFVVMEASSHALSQYRLGTMPIYLAAATDITCDDHIEYHGSPHAYIAAKGLLLSYYNPTIAVLPSPHHLWPFLTETTRAYSYIPQKAPRDEPLQVQWQWPNLQLCSTILSVLQIAIPTDLLQWVKEARVTGRFEATLWANNRIAWVDFAHTPWALQHVLGPWENIQAPGVWVIIGCGGRRDRSKRPLMLSIARRYASVVIITADNPRDEPFEQIVSDMTQNKTDAQVLVIEDRAAAIAYAHKNAPEGTHIFVLGKGHEKNQIIGTQTFSYSDIIEVQRYAAT